jgi:hypothetical protein
MKQHANESSTATPENEIKEPITEGQNSAPAPTDQGDGGGNDASGDPDEKDDTEGD